MNNLEVKLYQIKLRENYVYGKKEEHRLKFAEATSLLKELGVETNEWDEERDFNHFTSDKDVVIVDGKKYLELMEQGNDMWRLERVVKTSLNDASIFQQMADKQVTIETTSGNQYNTKCEVHMPGQALSTYNEILLMEDACSDALQNELTKGWRIIAACPQPDQRRPDYVLGRFCPESDYAPTEARRG